MFSERLIYISVVALCLLTMSVSVAAAFDNAPAPVLAVVSNPGGAPLFEKPAPDCPPGLVVPSGQRVLVEEALPSTAGRKLPVLVIDLPLGLRRGFMDSGSLRSIDPAQAFHDVPPGHWAAASIAEVSRNGLFQGFNNKFFGTKAFSRYEMAVVTARMFRLLRDFIEKSVSQAMLKNKGARVPRHNNLHSGISRLSVELDGLWREVEALKKNLSGIHETGASPAGRTGMIGGTGGSSAKKLAVDVPCRKSDPDLLKAVSRLEDELSGQLKMISRLRAKLGVMSARLDRKEKDTGISELRDELNRFRESLTLDTRLDDRSTGGRVESASPSTVEKADIARLRAEIAGIAKTLDSLFTGVRLAVNLASRSTRRNNSPRLLPPLPDKP